VQRYPETLAALRDRRGGRVKEVSRSPEAILAQPELFLVRCRRVKRAIRRSRA
jgi:hypothetical protein